MTTLNINAINDLIAALKLDMKHEIREAMDGNTYEFTDKAFNLGKWTHPCGAPACLAGHAVFQQMAKEYSELDRKALQELYKVRTSPADSVFNFTDKGAAILGLGYSDADKLFIPTLDQLFGYDDFEILQLFADSGAPRLISSETMRQLITPAMAIKVLEHLLRTEEVDWRIVKDELVPLLKAEQERNLADYVVIYGEDWK